MAVPWLAPRFGVAALDQVQAAAVPTVLPPSGEVHCPLVSVVIPHFNDLDGLARCLEALRRQAWPAEALEVVVADNNSACGLEAVRAAVGRFYFGARFKVVPAPLQGAGPARNAGIAASIGSIVALIDSDCIPEPSWIAEGVRGLREFDLVGGQVTTTAENPAAPNPVEAFEIVFNFNQRKYIEKDGFAVTANLFLRRDIFDEVGPFRSVVSEDVDWCHRARAAGFRLGYVEAARMSHPARRDWPSLRARWARMMKERAALEAERPMWHIRWALRAIAMPLSVAPHAVKVMRHPRLPSWQSRMEAIWILARIRLVRMKLMLGWLAAGEQRRRMLP